MPHATIMKTIYTPQDEQAKCGIGEELVKMISGGGLVKTSSMSMLPPPI